jgi:hypothetical protein
LEVIEQACELSSGSGSECGVARKLGLAKLDDSVGGIGGNEGILTSLRVELCLLQKVLSRIELVEVVAVRDANVADVGEGGSDLA